MNGEMGKVTRINPRYGCLLVRIFFALEGTKNLESMPCTGIGMGAAISPHQKN